METEHSFSEDGTYITKINLMAYMPLATSAEYEVLKAAGAKFNSSGEVTGL